MDLEENIQQNTGIPLSDSDFGTDVVDRLLRESSIDHLLPEDPDECSNPEKVIEKNIISENTESSSTAEREISINVELMNEESNETALARHSDYKAIDAKFLACSIQKEVTEFEGIL